MEMVPEAANRNEAVDCRYLPYFYYRIGSSSNFIALFLLLIGSLLTGFGFILLLPPLEGFDETAHYSYVQQLSQTGTFPKLTDPISVEIEQYLDVAPEEAPTTPCPLECAGQLNR